MGWDDNGLNVERRVQLVTGTIVDPTLPYDPDFRRPEKVDPKARPIPVSRPNFIELCEEVVAAARGGVPRPLVDRRPVGRLGPHLHARSAPRPPARRQRGFLRLVDARPRLPDRVADAVGRRHAHVGRPGRARRPRARRARTTSSCSTAPTAAAARSTPPGPSCCRPAWPSSPTPTTSATSRCSARPATTPLFGVVGPDRRPRAGRSREGHRHRHDLHVRRHHRRHVVARAVAAACAPSCSATAACARSPGASRAGSRPTPAAAQAAYDELAGKTVKQAQARIVELLTEAGRIEGEIRPITHPVKFWENGTRPLEIVTSQQWFIRYPAEGRACWPGARSCAWWPDFMRVRYENWVNGLIGDWNITRQRFFGVPFPVWYPIDADGVVDFLSPILADEDVAARRPHHRRARPATTSRSATSPAGFAADPDVMDTWATSSLTPADRRAAGWTTPTCSSARSRWTCGRRPTRSSAPGCSPRSSAATTSTTACRGPTPPSPGSSSTPTARSCRSRPATRPTTRSTLARAATAPTPSATGRPTAARAWTSPSTRAR